MHRSSSLSRKLFGGHKSPGGGNKKNVPGAAVDPSPIPDLGNDSNPFLAPACPDSNPFLSTSPDRRGSTESNPFKDAGNASVTTTSNPFVDHVATGSTSCEGHIVDPSNPFVAVPDAPAPVRPEQFQVCNKSKGL